MSRRAERARERSRKAVEAHTPPIPEGMVEGSFEDMSMEQLQEQAERDVYVEVARERGQDPLGMLPAEQVQHNHMTRDIKPHGQCPACDEYHALEAGRR